MPLLQSDYKFFVGYSDCLLQEKDVVVLDCKDDYNSLPEKTLGIIKYALAKGYDYILKIDDDVYCRPERLVVPSEDYVGHAYGHPNYASGAAYWLSAKAIEAIVSGWVRRSVAEDACVGQSLEHAGIKLTEDPRYRVGWKSFPHELLENEFPNPFNDTITFHLYFPQYMVEMHKNWDTRKQYITPPKGDLVVI